MAAEVEESAQPLIPISYARFFPHSTLNGGFDWLTLNLTC